MMNSASRLLSLPPVLALLAQEATSPPPQAPIHPVSNDYFGQKIVDPYRWMEDGKNPELRAWMKAQSTYARTYLDHLPHYAALLERSRQVETGDVQIERIVHAGKRYVYSKLRPGESRSKLYVGDGLGGPERLVYDPAKDPADQQHSSISDFQLSDDAHYASYLTAHGGSEYGDIHVVDLDTGRALPDVIPNTRWFAGSWGPDGKSLLYIQLPDNKPGTPPAERMQKMIMKLHRFGEPVSLDQARFGYGVDSHISIAAAEQCGVSFVKGSPYVLAWVSTGVAPERDFYVARTLDFTAATPAWQKIASRIDKVKNVAVHGDDLYLLSFKDTPHFQILQTSAVHPDLARAETVIPANAGIIQEIGAARDGLYFTTLEGGPKHVYRFDYLSKQKEEIPLPLNTSGDFVAPDGTEDGVLIRLNSWAKAPAIYSWNPPSRKLIDTGIQSPSSLEPALSKIEITTVKVPSYDGTLIPLVIFARKGTPRNGANPLMLEGYGAYGTSITSPQFQPWRVPWFEEGGVLAIAGVRGGGEYGEEWHLAGKIATKPNTWKDFIACAEYLVAQHYTSPEYLAAEGGSAGGLLVGNAITERPDLFRAAVMNVPLTDTLRSETTAGGFFNIDEFGSAKTEPGFRALLAMDAYHKVKDGIRYPAVLFLGGMNDPRVLPFFSAKMAARLQAATASQRPVVLDFDNDAGHGIGSSQEQFARQDADQYAFLLAQLSK